MRVCRSATSPPRLLSYRTCLEAGTPAAARWAAARRRTGGPCRRRCLHGPSVLGFGRAHVRRRCRRSRRPRSQVDEREQHHEWMHEDHLRNQLEETHSNARDRPSHGVHALAAGHHGDQPDRYDEQPEVDGLFGRTHLPRYLGSLVGILCWGFALLGCPPEHQSGRKEQGDTGRDGQRPREEGRHGEEERRFRLHAGSVHDCART